MRKTFAILLFLGLYSNLNAESVFSLDWKKDIPLSALAIGLTVTSLFTDTLPDQIPHSLSRSDVNAFDRPFMFTRLNTPVRYTATTMMITMAAVLPVLPVLDNFNMNTLFTYGVMYSQATLLAYGTRDLIRNPITRFRPYLHDGRELRAEDRHDSFPSGHTCVAFMSATFFTTTFLLEHPNSRWKWPGIIGSYTLATCIGAMRVISGMHFLTDVLAGAAIGSFYGWVIPIVHKRQDNNNFAVNLTGNGFLVSLSI